MSSATRVSHTIRTSAASAAFAASVLLGAAAHAEVSTTATTSQAALAQALHPAGLTITSITVRAGQPGQIGTYTDFNLGPVTIRDGIVLSSGSVDNLGPIPEAQLPGYDPAWPPAQVNSQMTADPDSGGTVEFDEYGAQPGHIENFYSSYDVAAIEVHFTLDDTYQVQFDFVFGSVEFPFWTSSYTDAFLVFLDGTAPENQITYDTNGVAIQVGKSFAGLETTADVNSAFSDPHGVIHHLTTTTAEMDAGEHVLIFEVGDVNDHILDSAVFITDLRTGSGQEGTGESEDDLCPQDIDRNGSVDGADLGLLLAHWNEADPDADLDGNGIVDGADLGMLLAAWGPC